MAKPSAPADETTQLHLRVPTALVKRLDAWLEHLNARGYARWTRAALIVAACEQALDAHAATGAAPERPAPAPPAGPRPARPKAPRR
jgi:hypothetical protein